MTALRDDPGSALLEGFDWQSKPRLVFGAHAADQTGKLAVELSAKHVLLVTDRGLVDAGHAARLQHALEAEGLAVTVFDQVEENPSTHCVDHCVTVAQAGNIDTIVGLGGGSSLDTAKGCNFILTNGGRMQDYWGMGKARLPMLPLIAVPTTAGTGSECQSFALITDEATHQKMACGDPKALPRISILDPVLTMSQPAAVTARTGLDALSHALETAVTKKRNAISELFSREAFRLIQSGFTRVLENPDDQRARARMLLGSSLAGMAIENSMLGAAHATANPLTARCGLVHGAAVGIMLPSVIQFNAQDPAAQLAYADLAIAAGLAESDAKPDQAVSALIGYLEQLLDLAGQPRSLAGFGVSPDALPALAQEAARQWTGTFNPRTLALEDFAQLYQAAFKERAWGSASAKS
jgi:alcohol dehydrogenase